METKNAASHQKNAFSSGTGNIGASLAASHDNKHCTLQKKAEDYRRELEDQAEAVRRRRDLEKQKEKGFFDVTFLMFVSYSQKRT